MIKHPVLHRRKVAVSPNYRDAASCRMSGNKWATSNIWLYNATMSKSIAVPRIDKMRTSARHIVRELGFMQRGLAIPDRQRRAHPVLGCRPQTTYLAR